MQLSKNNAVSPILSATGRACCPGFILIETQFASDVYSLSPAIENIYPKKASTMPPEIVLDCLGGPISIWTPQAPGWVRLASFPYRRDLAFISHVDPRTLDATLILVPRVDFTHPEDSRSRKPPPQALFHAPAVRACFGEKRVEKRNSVFIFDDKIYHADGFLEVQSTKTTVIPENTTPTEEELYWFHQSSKVPTHWLDAAHGLIKRHTLQIGNKVKVTRGDRAGTIAKIVNILDGEAVQLEAPTSFLSPKVTFEMSIFEVRKHISIGDEVIVTAGPHKETTGWVITVGDGHIQVFNHKTCQHVSRTLIHCVRLLQKLTLSAGDSAFILCGIPEHRVDLGSSPSNLRIGNIRRSRPPKSQHHGPQQVFDRASRTDYQ